ncbi:hypothetical protein QZM56_08815 [Burkholderia contaminans]|uniref:Uncharacterized protein n=1 Tax=Burkholderia contaminans TaxID=488447 RepID=A0AAP4R2D5_9BURK|nr:MULTISPECIES: hypothetical protein [unclassified Burkholderia]MDN7564594.1 hypothetical protein [Burkholderia contaminans]
MNGGKIGRELFDDGLLVRARLRARFRGDELLLQIGDARLELGDARIGMLASHGDRAWGCRLSVGVGRIAGNLHDRENSTGSTDRDRADVRSLCEAIDYSGGMRSYRAGRHARRRLDVGAKREKGQ